MIREQTASRPPQVVALVKELARAAAWERRIQRRSTFGEPNECIAFGRATAFAHAAKLAWANFGSEGRVS